jgi:hypothetical protein
VTGEAAACAANLGPRQGARRLALGILILAVAAICVAILVHRGLSPGTRLALFPVWWAGFAGLLEARRRT